MKLMMGMSLLTSAKPCIVGFDAKTDSQVPKSSLVFAVELMQFEIFIYVISLKELLLASCLLV